MKMQPRAILLFTLILFNLTFNLNAIGLKNSGNIEFVSRNMEAIVKKLEKGNRVEGERIGIFGSDSKQWALFEELKKLATKKELSDLTEHNNASVRCYAFQALLAIKAENIFQILKNSLADTTMVVYQSGCIVTKIKTADYFIMAASNRFGGEYYSLNENERNELDSILIYDERISLSAKNSCLMSYTPKDKDYSRIKEIIQTEQNLAALRTLARFEKKEDVELIKSFLVKDSTQTEALYAVREFPNEEFYPYVLEIFEKEWNSKHYDHDKLRICFQCLANYPRPKTFEIFEMTTKTEDQIKYQTTCSFLLIAITKYPNQYFEPLKGKIVLDDLEMLGVKEYVENDY